jgi:hypothetical protein
MSTWIRAKHIVSVCTCNDCLICIVQVLNTLVGALMCLTGDPGTLSFSLSLTHAHTHIAANRPDFSGPAPIFKGLSRCPDKGTFCPDFHVFDPLLPS